jgi:acetyl esterase
VKAPRSTLLLELVVWMTFYVLPGGVRRVLAGRPLRMEGQTLDPDMRLLLRLERLTTEGGTESPARRRRHQEMAAGLGGGRPVAGVSVIGTTVPGPSPTPGAEHGELPARLYVPEDLPTGSPLLVFLHGGSWVTGSLNTHEALCRYLALRAGVRVLSIDYRLAPENPFPAAVEDALAAFRYARTHARDLGADPAAIAMGGDSAGANLSAVTAYLTARAGEETPAFLLLLYPPCDAVNLARSREHFGRGFFLTEADIEWAMDHYFPSRADRGDPRASTLLAEDLSGLPPTYLATAGFDPLRDEGEMYARRLAEAGVPVVLRRHPDLIHGFANMIGLSSRCREAVAEAASALRIGVSQRTAAAQHDTDDDLAAMRQAKGCWTERDIDSAGRVDTLRSGSGPAQQ